MGLGENKEYMKLFGLKNGKNKDAICFSYQRTGGATGAYYKLFLEGNRFTVNKSEGNGCRDYRKTYRVSDETLAQILEIVESSVIEQWKNDFPRKDTIAYDGEIISVSLLFGNGKNISFNSDCVISQEWQDCVRRIVCILENIISPDKIREGRPR